MGTISIYDPGTDRKFTVTFDLKKAVSSVTTDGKSEFYLDISTSLRRPSGAAFSHYKVQDLTDTSLIGYPTATDWTDLSNNFIQYFMDEAELVVSSSSSSQSSSSSSEGYTTSSSSSTSESSPSSSSSSSSTSLSSSSSSSTSESSSSSSSTSESSSSSSSSGI